MIFFWDPVKFYNFFGHSHKVLSIHSLTTYSKNILSDLYFPDNVVRHGTCPQVAYWQGGRGKQVNGPLQYNVTKTLLLRMELADANKYKVLTEH